MRVLPGFAKEAIRDYAKASIAPGSRVLSDGLSCFNGLVEADMRHVVKITGGGRPESSDFKWVNTGLGNVKSAITGTLRSCDPQHASRYLAAFEWRYNRRFEKCATGCAFGIAHARHGARVNHTLCCD